MMIDHAAKPDDAIDRDVGDRTTGRSTWSRRDWCLASATGLAAGLFPMREARSQPDAFALRYLLASCMYGYQHVGEILPEVRKTGAVAIDLWPKVHGNQREQLDDLGESKFAEMLKRHDVTLGCLTQYPLGPFGLADEMRLAGRLGCRTIVTGARGPKGLNGDALRDAVRDFAEKMKPHLAIAEETGVTIAIENHADSLIDSPDSLKWLAELRPTRRLAVALAPYHLPQDVGMLARLIESLGDAIAIFYAWQHGKGCHPSLTLTKDEQLLQMAGRGELDFGPLLEALRRIRFEGWTEIFMHPIPRGVPILEPVAAVTAEILRARDYLEQRLCR